MMRLLIISLIFCSSLNAQILPGFIGLASKPYNTGTEYVSTFNYSSLTDGTIQEIAGHSGTTVITGKKYTNTNIGTMYGSALYINGGQGKIEIKNSSFENTAGEAIQAENFGNGVGDTIDIHDNFFANNKNGIYLTNCHAVIRINYNECINPHGARLGKGQFIQFNAVTGQSTRIEYNRIKGFWGEVYSEDLISMFGGTSGGVGDSIYIRYNQADGGGPSPSGGGFICGDGDGTRVVISDNVLRNPGNYVVNVAGGTGLVLRNNKGYQRTWIYSNNIATYAYITGASSVCGSVTIINNKIKLQKDNNYYWWGDPGETCGDVTGINEGAGSPDAGWLSGNSKTITDAEVIALQSSPFIKYVTEDYLWDVREGSIQFRHASPTGGWDSPGDTDGWPPTPFRPTANAGSDQSISITTATLSGSGGDTYRWVQVSGPNTATMSASTSATNNLSGLVNGVYIFRLEVYSDDDYSNGDISSDADRVQITKS